MGWRVRADEEGEIEVREGGVGRYCSCQASATICAGRSGRCRSIWRQVLATAGPSGGKFRRCRSIWRQVLAAAGPLQGRYTHPSFNGAAAVEYVLCYLQV